MKYRNTYRYIDVLRKFVSGYNDTVHSATGMAPSKVRILIYKRYGIRCVPNIVPYDVRQSDLVWVIMSESVKKFNFAKGGEQNYPKVVRIIPRPVYDLHDLLSKHIDGQF